MTVITVRSPAGRISVDQQRVLAQTLTDAVLEVEIGTLRPAARVGFQVWFEEFDLTAAAIGGQLLSDADTAPDVGLIDVAVMDGHWPPAERGAVIIGLLNACEATLAIAPCAPSWWVNFRVIEEGSWGSRGGPLSILDLLQTGLFTEEKEAAIRAVVAAPANVATDQR